MRKTVAAERFSLAIEWNVLAGRISYRIRAFVSPRFAGHSTPWVHVSRTSVFTHDETHVKREVHAEGGRRLCQSVCDWNSRPIARRVFSENGDRKSTRLN